MTSPNIPTPEQPIAPREESEAITPFVEEEVFGATYPESETPGEILDRRTKTAQSWETERRAKWEQVVEARQANPDAIVDYRYRRS